MSDEIKGDIRRIKKAIALIELVDEWPFKSVKDYKDFMGHKSILVAGLADTEILLDPLALLQLILHGKKDELKNLSKGGEDGTNF